MGGFTESHSRITSKGCSIGNVQAPSCGKFKGNIQTDSTSLPLFCGKSSQQPIADVKSL